MERFFQKQQYKNKIEIDTIFQLETKSDNDRDPNLHDVYNDRVS